MSIDVYLAGPLFTQAERDWNLALADRLVKLEPRIRVFVPQIETAPAFETSPPDFSAVRRICIGGVESSDVLLAILDGADADSGTCFECGYANARGTPIVGVRTDIRAGEDDGINAMLTRSCAALVKADAADDLDVVARRIAEAVTSVVGN